ncbi:MAG: hypothetical protein ACE5JH_10750 [Acidobacteriota bacterium]
MSRRADHATPPPLVLRCRPGWRAAWGLSAVSLLGVGTAGLAGSLAWPAGAALPGWAAALVLLLGAGCACFAGRYCLSRLVLDERGFRLVGPLVRREVPWRSVIRWERRSPRGGPAMLRVVHGPQRRRLMIPLIYEDSHALEVGLAQGHFPLY